MARRAMPAKALLRSVVVCCILALAAPAAAQSKRENADVGAKFVGAFVVHCIDHIGDYSRLVAMAEAREYLKLPEAVLAPPSPDRPTFDEVTYLAQSGLGAPFILNVAKGRRQGQVYVNCSVLDTEIDPASVEQAWFAAMRSRTPDFDETRDGQRSRVWIVPRTPHPAYFTFVHSRPGKGTGAELGLQSVMEE